MRADPSLPGSRYTPHRGFACSFSSATIFTACRSGPCQFEQGRCKRKLCRGFSAGRDTVSIAPLLHYLTVTWGDRYALHHEPWNIRLIFLTDYHQGMYICRLNRNRQPDLVRVYRAAATHGLVAESRWSPPSLKDDDYTDFFVFDNTSTSPADGSGVLPYSILDVRRWFEDRTRV